MFIESLKAYSDDRGELRPFNFSELPFSPKRMFLVSEAPKGITRGEHAHYETEQFLICLEGEITVSLYDGVKETVKTLKPFQGIYIPNMVWDSQKFNTGKDLLLVLASTEYNQKDYITSLSLFEGVVKK
jgi:dTDP-4-dehydrorhamnose 3,5-epimerase-like enzyme